MEKRADRPTIFDDSQMVTLLFDLFAAGTDTTSNTLHTLTLYLMTHTHIQEQCHKEIDEVLGAREHVTFEDRYSMPYVQAVIYEAQCVADIIPHSMFHTASRNTKLQGYNIPKGPACLGESLARMELFLIMVTILQQFRLIWPEDAGAPDIDLIYNINNYIWWDTIIETIPSVCTTTCTGEDL